MDRCVVVGVTLFILSASLILAVPLNEDEPLKSKALERSRRDLEGVWNSVSSGFESAIKGAKTVGRSIKAAFEGIFSTNNKNALSNGFENFGKSMKDAWSGLFGSNGEVTKGVNKVAEKIKGAFTGEGASRETPEGQVPQEETT